jgi:hypothetical protein
MRHKPGGGLSNFSISGNAVPVFPPASASRSEKTRNGKKHNVSRFLQNIRIIKARSDGNSSLYVISSSEREASSTDSEMTFIPQII